MEILIWTTKLSTHLTRAGFNTKQIMKVHEAVEKSVSPNNYRVV